MKLRRQSIEVLAALIEKPGQMVRREELEARLWPDARYSDFTGGLNNAVNRLREALGDSAGQSRYIETVPGMGYRFIGSPETGEVPKRNLRLAVMPVQNLSGDPDNDWLGDGITEEVITTLAGLDPARLVVIARTSSMHYKGSTYTAATIGRELDVDYILEVSLRRQDKQGRVTAQLVRVKDEGHVWAQTYDDDIGNIFDFQDRVAHAIGDQLRIAVALPAARPRNPAAWDCWIQGLYHYNVGNAAGIESGVRCFEEGVRIDPGFGRCWARLASALTALAFWGLASVEDTLIRAKNAARRSLELDDRSAEAFVALGMVSWYLDWNLAEAERRLARAIALAPNDPGALGASGVFRASMRSDFAGGAVQAERALDIDPFSVVAYSNAAWPSYWGRRYQRAIALCHRALEMDARSLMARHVLGASILALGQIHDAIAIFEQSYAEHGDPISLAFLAVASARAGARDRAEDIAASLEGWSDRRAVRPSLLTWVWAACGRNELALDWMERAIADRDVLVLWARISRWYDPLRSHPRFRSLLNRLPLAPELHAAAG